MKPRYWLLLFAAVVGGMYLSLMYVNPYNRIITLSETILQLSGSRGRFELGFSYYELAAFAMRLFPEFMIELYAGIMLYKNFCTASVYIFSRYPHRVKWYLKEVCHMGGAICVYNMLLLVTAILMTAIRYKLQMNGAGVMLLVYHFALHSLWVYVMTLLVNLFAVYLGSSTAYALTVSMQLICIVLLNLIDLFVRYYDGRLAYQSIVRWNPIAHLVLGWHDRNEEINTVQVALTSSIRMNFNASLAIFFLLGMILTFVGALIVKKHDLLISDIETGV